MNWLDRTHGLHFELVRHFLARTFDSEMFSSATNRSGGWTRVAIGALSMAIPAGMLLMDPPYAHQAIDPTPENLRAVAIADQLAVLTLAFAITGIVALLAWQSLFPSRRDYLALAGLPVRSRDIFAARFTSICMMAGVLVVAMLPGFQSPHQFTAHTLASVPAATKALAHIASSGLGCLFVFFGIVALQGVLLNVLPSRWFARVSTYVQGLLIAAFFFGGLFSWAIVNWRQDMIARLPQFADFAPPIWFAGLHGSIIGNSDPFFAAMTTRALAVTAAALLLALVTYALAYSRYQALLLEVPEILSRRRSPGWRLLRLLAGSGASGARREAILEFLAQTLSRSRMHRLVLLGYLGAALGIMLNSALVAGVATRWAGGSAGILRFICLYWPLGFSVIVLASFRHVFSLPADLPANWLFRLTESHGRRDWMSAVERFMIGCVIVPIHVVTLPVAASVLGWPIAARMTALELLVSLTVFEVLFYSWQQLPFTCSYVPGKRTLVEVLGIWLAVLVVLVPALARIIAAMSQWNEPFLIFAVIFGSVWLWARKQRSDGWGEAKLMFEDLAETVPHLGISEMSHRWS
jgi:hypothetical protein